MCWGARLRHTKLPSSEHTAKTIQTRKVSPFGSRPFPLLLHWPILQICRNSWTKDKILNLNLKSKCDFFLKLCNIVYFMTGCFNILSFGHGGPINAREEEELQLLPCQQQQKYQVHKGFHIDKNTNMLHDFFKYCPILVVVSPTQSTRLHNSLSCTLHSNPPRYAIRAPPKYEMSSKTLALLQQILPWSGMAYIGKGGG